MSFESFQKCQMLSKQSTNLTKLGYDFRGDTLSEYLKVQNLLMTRYHIEQGSMLTIMKEFGIPSSRTMDTLFREFEITARTLSEAATLSIEQERIDPMKNWHSFVHIWHGTWDAKKVLLRSSLEKRLAEFYDTQQIRYEVESLRLKYFDHTQNLYRVAIPDFYLPDDNRIVEVKSTYWLDAENMRAKARGYVNLGFKFSLYLDGELIENWSLSRDSNPDLDD